MTRDLDTSVPAVGGQHEKNELAAMSIKAGIMIVRSRQLRKSHRTCTSTQSPW